MITSMHNPSSTDSHSSPSSARRNARSAHYSPLLFDLQDHKLIQMVNNFVTARAQDNTLAQPEAGLHPHGII